MGAGAVGCFLGVRLALAGHEAVLVGRPPLVSALQGAGGLTLLGPYGERSFAAGVAAATSIAGALDHHGQPDLVIVAVKAYDTGEAAGQLRAAGIVSPLLTLQNGIGNEEVLAQALGAGSVIAGAIETPVSVPAPGTVQVHRARYQVGLAPAGSRAPVAVAARALSESGLLVTCFGDHRSLKWTKLLMNLPANALCAILRWSPAQVMGDRDSARLEARAWQEALAVMARAPIRPVALAGYPFPFLVPLARRLPPAGLAVGLRGFVSGGRGSKMPSLQMALEAGRRSEVNWLNGAVARCGAELGVPTPVNGTYARLLMDLTEGRAGRAEYEGRPRHVAELVEARPPAAR